MNVHDDDDMRDHETTPRALFDAAGGYMRPDPAARIGLPARVGTQHTTRRNGRTV